MAPFDHSLWKWLDPPMVTHAEKGAAVEPESARLTRRILAIHIELKLMNCWALRDERGWLPK